MGLQTPYKIAILPGLNEMHNELMNMRNSLLQNKYSSFCLLLVDLCKKINGYCFVDGDIRFI